MKRNWRYFEEGKEQDSNEEIRLEECTIMESKKDKYTLLVRDNQREINLVSLLKLNRGKCILLPYVYYTTIYLLLVYHQRKYLVYKESEKTLIS